MLATYLTLLVLLVPASLPAPIAPRPTPRVDPSPATRRPSLAADLALAAQSQAPGRIQQQTLEVPDVGTVEYGLRIPAGYDPARPRPLVLALHPGGPRMKAYGAWFAAEIVSPALGNLDPIIVAPDCPTRSWTDVPSERGVMAVLEHVLERYAIDRKRILVIGYSLGGRGTWFFSSRHADLFTAAIPMASPPGSEPVDRLATIPTYVIHSRDDEVAPFEPDERTARELEKMGRPIKFAALRGLRHYDMGGYIDALRTGVLWVAQQWRARP